MITGLSLNSEEKAPLLLAVRSPIFAVGFGLGPIFPYFCLRMVFNICYLLAQKSASMVFFIFSQSTAAIRVQYKGLH